MALFQPGHKLAPGGKRPGAGRKPDTLKAELRRLLDTAVPLKDRRELVQKAAEKAREGSFKHLELILAYAYGKPAQILQVSGEGGGPVLVEYVNDWREQPAEE